MRVGMHIANFTWAQGIGPIRTTLRDIADAAEQGGVSQITFMDHYFQMEQLGGPALDMLEGYTSLGYLAGITERVRLGLLVTGVTYRNPGILAKQVTTLDVLSGGRAMLGIGAAWYEREHLGLGVAMPPLGERFDRLEETLQICLQMWSDDDGSYDGRYYLLAETLNLPQSIQRPHPPILIGGMGPKRTLPLTARYGDACNFFTIGGLEAVGTALATLRGHCEAIGRDYDGIEKTILYTSPPPTVAQTPAFLTEMQGYADLGVDMVILTPGGPHPAEEVQEYGRTLVPALTDLPG
ncbi:MAG: LLM class F420-dependent oxidoreductase [Actinobacteria bacterium]|nr:LLM class F420-dependent oxidoreductase [Actinomycetota bacterium]